MNNNGDNNDNMMIININDNLDLLEKSFIFFDDALTVFINTI